MAMNRESLLRLLPQTIKDAKFASIDLDFTGLTIPDILRNLNTAYPKISRDRNMVASGELVLGILVKSELLYPFKGIVLLLSDDKTEINVESSKYLIFAMDEASLSDEDSIDDIMNGISKFLIHESKNEILHFNDFYLKFIYNPYEEERDNHNLYGDSQ